MLLWKKIKQEKEHREELKLPSSTGDPGKFCVNILEQKK